MLRGTAPSLNRVLSTCKLKLPVVVKPASQGSTIGVTIVRKPSQWKEALRTAHRYDEEAMVEAFIPGHEVTVSLLGGPDGVVTGLPAVEIVAMSCGRPGAAGVVRSTRQTSPSERFTP